MFRLKTVSAHCAETSVSAIVEVLKHPLLQSLKFGWSVPNIRFLRNIYNFGIICITFIICVACHSILILLFD